MKKKNKKKNIIFIIIVSLICIFVILLGLLVKYNDESNNAKNEIQQSQIEDSVKNIINRLGSIFQKEVPSEEKGFSTDIYLSFKYNLFENNKSQQVMYENLIKQVSAKKMASFRLIDENKNIIIRVYYDNSDNAFYYTVNGEEAYFENANAKKVFENKLEVDEIAIDVNSEELKKIIDNDLKSNTDIGAKKETSCGNYDIYFDEGIKIRNIDHKVYNIVFTKNYKKNVVNNLKVGEDFETIESKLGQPSFEDEDVIGYKSKKLYVFFTVNEISVYGIEKYSYEGFEEILKQYVEDKIDVKTFTDKLTDLWPDYDEFKYDSTYVDLCYSSKGVSMVLNSKNPKNIIIYSNYDKKDNLKSLMEDNLIVGSLDKDLMFETEKNRIQKDISTRNMEHLENPEYVGESKLFSENISNNKIEFYSRNNELPDCTLLDVVNSYVWVNDTIFVYSVTKNGIYYFDLDTREKHELLVEDEKEKHNYDFKSYEDGVLVYDDNESLKISE